MAGSAGDQKYLCIDKSQIHIQTANTAHTINTNINSKYSLIIYFQKEGDVTGILV